MRNLPALAQQLRGALAAQQGAPGASRARDKGDGAIACRGKAVRGLPEPGL